MRAEHIIERQGKRYALYSGLLDEAHEQGLTGIDTTLLQAPTESNNMVAIARAIVVMDPDQEPQDRRRFTGIGDASPENVGRAIIPHLIRMAETRAKARALRDAVNVSEAILDDAEVEGEEMGPRPVRSDPRASSEAAEEQITVSDEEIEAMRGEAGVIGKPDPNRARKSQVDMLRTLAVEWRGEGGAERLEARIGKPLVELSRDEANEWIDRLTPEHQR